MERRQHPRYSASFPVRVTDFGDNNLAKQANTVSGHMVDISQSGVGVLIPVPVPAHSAVRLHIAESVFYGHVAYCGAEGPEFRIGVAVEQVLLGGNDLGGILQQVLLEQMPSTPGVLSADAYLG